MDTSRKKTRSHLYNSFFYCLIVLFFSSCSHSYNDSVVLQAKTRAMQTRTFVAVDAKSVTKEMINVLQDEGFMVRNVSNEIGLITAEKDTNIEKFSSKFWAYIFSGRRAKWKKHSVVEITSNITEEQGKTKLRINFVVRIFNNLGRVVDVYQILEENAYIDFFNKVQKGLLTNQKS